MNLVTKILKDKTLGLFKRKKRCFKEEKVRVLSSSNDLSDSNYSKKSNGNNNASSDSSISNHSKISKTPSLNDDENCDICGGTNCPGTNHLSSCPFYSSNSSSKRRKKK